MSKTKSKTKSNEVQYALWSDYTDSLITGLYDSIEDLKMSVAEGDFDSGVDDEIENCKVCKIEMLNDYGVELKPILEKL